ncbi:hypothetical protein KFL_005860050 [Klebsormidium nitens]|uniref:Uncharacterized protein n=1 Tax=Klebsormidium nitens TaxID=105231 RepID=A0A1Y1IMG9_KLENI|nr:hypothetical protein KFL_005860050 [Klebsormidium nitens]|eukprot:GAQ89986.1 hypothetical protein KFL_005860050 [Klebsormidium nitens]
MSWYDRVMVQNITPGNPRNLKNAPEILAEYWSRTMSRPDRCSVFLPECQYDMDRQNAMLEVPSVLPKAPNAVQRPADLASAASQFPPKMAASVAQAPAGGLREKGGITFLRGNMDDQGKTVHKIDPREMDLNLLALARTEYVNILGNVLTDPIREGLVAQYDTSKAESPKPAEVVRTYQKVLKEVTLWNNHIVQAETERILGDSKTMLQNLLAAIYISNLKIMASIRISKGVSYVSLTIPSCESFIHRIYIECARILYQNPYIMHLREHEPVELFKRSGRLGEIVSMATERATRAMLPVRELLEEYLNPDIFNGAVIGLDAPPVGPRPRPQVFRPEYEAPRSLPREEVFEPPPPPSPPSERPMQPSIGIVTPLQTVEGQPVEERPALPFLKSNMQKKLDDLPPMLREKLGLDEKEELKTIATTAGRGQPQPQMMVEAYEGRLPKNSFEEESEGSDSEEDDQSGGEESDDDDESGDD